MSFRAIVLGLLGAALVCAITYFNDAIMHHTFMIGNNMPIFIYAILILFVLLINPLSFRLWRRLALSGAEITVALALTIAVCCIPGSGLMRTFTATLVMPFQYQRTTPSWQEHKAIEKVPPYMLADVNKQNENDVLNGFVQGLGIANKHIAFSQVPWSAWAKTLTFWIPMILTLWLSLLGLALVVHRQWADHEQLPYPIARFTHALLPRVKEKISEVGRSRMFWIATIIIMGIHLNNYACVWFPQAVPFPLRLDFSPLTKVMPTMAQGGGWHYFKPTIYFTVVAFAFFLATDVSFALGFGPQAWFYITGLMAGYGIALRGPSPCLSEFLNFGAYTGILLALGYTGRYFYGHVFRQALFIPTKEKVKPESVSVWGARLFIVATAIFIGYLVIPGKLDWQLAVLLTGGCILTFLVMSRVIAETGVFFIQAYWTPTAIMMGFFGSCALGPQAMLLMTLFTSVLLIDPREAFMPFTMNSLKLLDLQQVNIGKAAGWIVVALLVGFAVAVPVTLYFQYDRGANMMDAHALSNTPKIAFNEFVRIEQRLEAQHRLEESNRISGWGHITHISPDPKLMVAFGIGLLLTVVCIVGRLRFSRWPIHPVFFILWATYPAAHFFFSFTLGWAIKVLVTKYGGGRIYRQLYPLMFGLIAGEMLGGGIAMIIGFVYYLITGLPPKSFSIMPG